jgi:hypothetical protein
VTRGALDRPLARHHRLPAPGGRGAEAGASIALFGPLIAPPEPARVAIRARAAKARGEGAAGMHEIALGLLNAAISAETRQRSRSPSPSSARA